jgi:hypothetical protein
LQKYPIFSKKDQLFYNIKYICFNYELGKSNSILFTTNHDSLPALLPSFLALAHLPVSCFLYFFPSRIWSTNYSGLVFASKSIFLFLDMICLIRSVSGPCRSVQKCLLYKSPVHRDSPILWIDMFMPSAHALASQWPRPQSLNSQDCGSEGITPYIYSVVT